VLCQKIEDMSKNQLKNVIQLLEVKLRKKKIKVKKNCHTIYQSHCILNSALQRALSYSFNKIINYIFLNA